MKKCIICGSYVESENGDYCNHCKPRKGCEADILKEQLRKFKQELIESEKTIEDLEVELFREKLDKECDDRLLIQNCEKEKIEFAIEQLEKVKELIHNVVNLESPEYDLVGLYDDVSEQIKRLEEQK